MKSKSTDYIVGQIVTVIPNKYQPDEFAGQWFVAGHSGPDHLKLGNDSSEDWEVMIHLQRIAGSLQSSGRH